MNINVDKRKSITNKFALVITLIGLFVLISGTSYAILRGNTLSDKEQVIKTGNVTLKLTENFESIDKKITLLSDSDGLLQETTYDFNIKNIGGITARYDVKLINEVPNNYTGDVLPLEYIKVGLEINEEEYGPMSLGELEGIIDSGIIYKKEVINYKLRIWLDKDKQSEVEELSDYKAFLKIKVEAEQRPDSLDDGKATVFNFTGEEQKYIVPRDGWYYVELGGASGGPGHANGNLSNTYGLGTTTSGYVELKAGEKLYFYVGGQGGEPTAKTCTNTTAAELVGTGGKGGYNGGGPGGNDSCSASNAANDAAGGGGGATDVRIYEKNENPLKFRYVRDYLNGSTKNASSHWVEIKVYDESGNVISQGKKVTYNGSGEHYGGTATSPSIITDGDTATANYFGLEETNQYVEVDLGKEYQISKVEVWHYYKDGRTYYNSKTELFNGDKTKNLVIYDSATSGTYAETSAGKSLDNPNLNKELIKRIMVAAGGGGGTYEFQAGSGGALHGVLSDMHTSNTAKINTAATQKSGYQLGIGSAGAYCTSSNVGSGGNGGGYYGSTVTSACTYYEGGAGGSSYISGYAGVNSVANNTTITHTKETLHYSGKYFIGGKIVEGQNDGDGYAKIQYVDIKPKRKNSTLNNVRYIKNCHSYNSGANSNIWDEIQAIKDGVNLAKGKTVTGSIAEHASHPYSIMVDGDIHYEQYARPSSYGADRCVTVDLGSTYDLDEVAVWNHFHSTRSFYNNVTSVSSDNSTWKTLIDDVTYETSNGHRVNAYTDTYNGYVSDGLLLWYDAYANTGATRNRTTTTWKNLASKSYDGTVNGATWDHNSLWFDGSASHVMIAEINPEQLTMEVVYKKPSFKSESENILSNMQNGGFAMVVTTEQKIRGQYYISGGYRAGSSYTIDLNKIQSFTSSYDLNYINSYIGGSLAEKFPYSGTIGAPGNSTYFAIGTNPTGSSAGGAYYLGQIYSVRLYNRALTDEEVKHNYLYDKEKFNLE